MKKKITIIGRGLDPSKHLSLEAIECLKNADKILGIESEKQFWENFVNLYQTKPVEDISFLYENNKKDIENYQTFINLILKNSSKHNHIALLVAGHPKIGISFIDMLKKQLNQIDIRLIEGISSFDVMLNFLDLDPLEMGTSIIDANRLLLFEYKIEPSINYFIYHICSIGNSKTNFKNPSRDNQASILKQYLLKFYNKNKELYLCRMSNGNRQPSKKIPLKLDDLDKSVSLIDFATTLYIPCEEPTKINFGFLDILRKT